MNKILDDLNEKQKEAVLSINGPVIVVAGAGSGKTRVLTRRIAYLIESGIKPWNILAVTFTNKASEEMKERVIFLSNENAKYVWISTFHSMGAKILRKNIQYVPNYKQGYDILDDDESIKYVKRVLKTLNLDNKEYPPKIIRSLISKKKNHQKYVLDKPFTDVFDRIYKLYEEYLQSDNAMDFDDLLLLTFNLFNENEEILNYYRDLFKYIMIDEFQDTNNLQYELIKLMVGGEKNIFIVGDQDQSIYSFRGANVGNINLFLRDFKNAKQIILDTNYRSTKQILSVANSVIKHNTNRIPKELKTDKTGGNKVVYKRMFTSYEEVDYVLQEIKMLVSEGYKYEDIAIFYRSNAMSREYEDVFMRNNIPYQIYGFSFFQRTEIKDIIAYLKLVVNINNNWAFKRVINVPKRGIGEASIKKLEETSFKMGISMMEAIYSSDLAKTTIDKIINFKNMIIDIQNEIKTVELKKYADFIIDKVGYRDMLKELEEEGENRLDNINEFKNNLANAEDFYEGDNFEKLEALLDDLSLKTDKDLNDVPDSVKLMTYHQAKGLEFPVVFMIAMEQGIFPVTQSMLSQYDLEEERRVCYVGMTRAQKLLYITNVEVRRRYGATTSMSPSLFVAEMDFSSIDNLSAQSLKQHEKQYEYINTFKNPYKIGDKVHHISYNDGIIIDVSADFVTVDFAGLEKTVKANNLILSKFSNISFKPGDKIKHQAFGNGVVVNVENEFITVAFDVKYGIKKLLSTHPSIIKL